MKVQHRSLFRSISLVFLLPGLAGLIVSAAISTYYVDTLPETPVPSELRMTPRSIHGTVVYLTQYEHQRLTALEDVSLGVFFLGLGLGLIYLRKWGIAYAVSGEDDEYDS